MFRATAAAPSTTTITSSPASWPRCPCEFPLPLVDTPVGQTYVARRGMPMRGIVTPDEVRQGLVSDVYFLRAQKVLEAEGIDRRVTAEFTAGHLPRGYACAHVNPRGGVYYPAGSDG